MSTLPLSRIAVIAVILGLLCGACAINPATGKRELSLIGEGQEVEMGREYDKQLVGEMGLYGGDALQNYVQTIGERLAAKSERPELPWTFRVVDDPAVNAFALPGGYIYLTRGILAHFTSEAQLASVIGHEIGHVTARHSVNQMSKAQLAQLGLGLGAVLSPEVAQQFGGLAQTGLGLLFLKYGRDDERQSDELGLRYMVDAGYDPRSMPDVFDTLRRLGESSGGSAAPAWLSTHPTPENRGAELEQQITALNRNFASASVAQDAYYRMIDGINFGADPRQGYFRDEHFFHPELEFRMQFPSGWKTQNGRTAVVAISPAQDAIVHLGLASQTTPAAALQNFSQQQGVTMGAPWRDRIGGFAAASRDFAAVTQNGQVRGLIAFLAHDGRVFGLLAYTPEAKYGSYSRSFESSLGSFDRLTDRAALAVEPMKLQIVRPTTTLTVQRFADRYASTVPVETLALINQVEVGDPLRAGEPWKVVTGGKLP